MIGKTSPVTYQVLGHLKTCLVLAFGYILLRDPFNWRNIIGILIALIGMILYSYYCTLEGQKKAVEASPQLQVLYLMLFYSLESSVIHFQTQILCPAFLTSISPQLMQPKEDESIPLVHMENGSTRHK